MTLTKQGVRDLNAIGPKGSRNKRERRHHNFDKICSHDITVEEVRERWSFNNYEDDSGYMEPYTALVCLNCGGEL